MYSLVLVALLILAVVRLPYPSEALCMLLLAVVVVAWLVVAVESLVVLAAVAVVVVLVGKVLPHLQQENCFGRQWMLLLKVVLLPALSM
jgi:hypothetical protein